MLINRRQFLDYTLKSAGGLAAAVRASQTFACEQFGLGASPAADSNNICSILFFDDWPLDRRDHVERHIGQPEWHPEATFVDPHLNVTWGYPSAFRDPDTGTWRCLYQGWDARRKRLYPLVAESRDGLRWHAPDLSRAVSLPGRDYPNQVLPVTNFSEWSPCYYDTRAGADERIKGLVFFEPISRRPKSYLWVSPDGLRWRCIDGVRWQRDAPDPVTCVFWNGLRRSYVLTTRPSLNDRRIAVAETKDWRTFSDPQVALEADALDTPLAQLYGMPVFPYEDWFIGLLWIYHVPPEVEGESPLKYLGGRIDSQLSYSVDGWHFQRGLRAPFMANSRPGQLGAGCLQPCCLLVEDDVIRIYSCAARHEHGMLTPGDGGLLLHTLRLHGFTYLEPTGGIGVIGTRPLLWQGGKLELNVLAPDGEARIQVTDSNGKVLQGYSFEDSISFTGDSIRWEPLWRDNRSLHAFVDQVLRIEVTLRNARLYSIRGNFQILTAAEVKRYEQQRQ